ncbi:ubiquitin-protein ligase molybdopterin-converting factor [Mycena albidolilacea]|uniref:Ubiquitin-protein ligase molybdopterin-converting factor n=1 Tax=Mycena albidolilacea TaxID=1033008 RepID=A0AAD6Z2E3_9AGAR|nr:ubiquitin-protein ligase molybdopterin-converting factor [Mycena albidolilacea]
MDGLLRSHRAQLVGTAVAAAATTATLISVYNSLSKRSRRYDLDKDVLRSISRAPKLLDGENKSNNHLPAPEPKYEYDEDLIREQLARNYAFFGDEAMAKVRKGTVVVVGCGGVGSWAAVMLVRSGLSKIRLVDFDYVTLSSLNRHATAALPDVGTPKVQCVARALKQIARWVEVDTKVEVWRKEDGAQLLAGADWVVDAIDNIQTKVDLLKYCHENGIKVFSSMGAGAKSDPTRVQIADIANTVYDPLARAVRQRLRRLGVPAGVPVVYSTEVPGDVGLLPLPEEEFKKGKVGELGVLDEWRVRILPVLGPLPAIFGLHIATYVLSELAGKPLANPLAIKNRRKLYERMLRDLQTREAKRAGTLVGRIPLDEDDVALLFEDVHRGRSVVPPHAVPVKPTLVRWDPARPLGVENVVVMDAGEAGVHESDGGEGGPGAWGEDVREAVRRRVEEVERWRGWVM